MARPIMIQGTMSNAGKSLLVAGLCRIFKQDGYKVTPFKSQNMALNSYITKEGLEMGRAQVMQAEAAKISPSVSMNPILLKPTNATGSQVIVNGKVRATMAATEYYANKKRFIPDIMEAYRSLEKEYDIIVIEGAGSPVEINLKENDIVNMGMANMVDAPVLLVGDIDRGGVFAQLVGTIALLEQEERERIKGVVINKFRGDKTLLKPGLDMLTERIHIPVTGVVPYLSVDVDDEDSLSERFSRKSEIGLVDIAVICLPRISNFTDFHPFELIEDVSIRYVKTLQELGNPDMIIIPGTKNTIEDLLWMRQCGLEAAILQHTKRGKLLFGVCGGYQMLGESIEDKEGVETHSSVAGMGLLPIYTVFQPSKVQTQVKGRFGEIKGILKELSHKEFYGYEIHMGISTFTDTANPLTYLTELPSNQNEKCDGTYQNNVYGSYVHGIFDDENVIKEIVSAIMKMKGYDNKTVKTFSLQSYKEKQYDLLADGIRENIDMRQIYNMLEGKL